MRHCDKCSGAIGEPGKAYGYAGKWCYCALSRPTENTILPSINDIVGYNPTQYEEFTIRIANNGFIVTWSGNTYVFTTVDQLADFIKTHVAPPELVPSGV